MKNELGVSVGLAFVVSVFMICPIMAAQVQATNRGLRVFVYVHNVPSYVFGQEVGVTVASENDVSIYRAVIIPGAENFFTKMQFDKHDVGVGESVSGCVFINDRLNECAYTTNGRGKQAERIDIYLLTANNNNGDSSSSSSASSSSSTSSSASASASSRICILATCLP
jgi:hypothetical protein